MKKLKSFLVAGFVTFLVVCFFGTTGMAEECGTVDNEPVATVMIGSSGISMSPRVSYASIVVNVSRPDGVVLGKTFQSGSTPYIGLSDLGDKYPDGVYNYELRVIFSPDMKVRRESDFSSVDKGIQSEKALTQSGSFMVQGGSIMVMGGVQETPARTLDVLHYDDVIITGSLCVGFDCVNGESFGYCTIKLKENNLQLCFEDTSTGTFPTNDWKIQINDTTSGGASYFTIWDTDGGRRVFTLEAGAPAHSLYVEDYGRVGLGTSIPYVELHIVDGDSPTVRLDQDGSSGWAPQSWDLCGNETNFFLRDVTNGSKLCFRVQPNTPSNTLCLRSDGKVGIGTWSPGYKFEVETTGANAEIVADRTDGARNFMNATTTHAVFGAINDFPVRIVTNNSWRMQLNTDNSLSMRSGATCNTSGQWISASSIEYKENIRNLTTEEAVETLNGLNPVKYNYKVNKAEEDAGFIAEEVPELVATKDRKGLNALEITAVLTKVVQEQQKTIAELKKKIAELEKK